MAQKSGSETLLLAVNDNGIVKIGLPPKNYYESFSDRAAVLGKLENASHVLCSPKGELFCVRGGDLYRGPMPSKEGVDWFTTAKRVGKSEWQILKILFFHPNGELYGVTYDGDFYKGPQPDNENVPWMYQQAKKIAVTDWDQCEVLLLDPQENLYAVTKEDKIVKGKIPTVLQEYKTWRKSATVVGGTDWLRFTRFMSFSSDGKLWAVDKHNGDFYRGLIPADGKYKDTAEKLGTSYHYFRYFSFTQDKTISKIISFDFLLDRGQRVSESPDVIEQKIYDNRKSSSTLKHTFTFDKTEKQTSTFSHEHGFTFAVGTEITFEAGIPCVEKTSAKLKIDLSTTHKWTFTDTNETQEKFTSTSPVEVAAGKAIRMVASVVKAKLKVPYRAKVKTLFGFETVIEGTWSGVSLYNLKVTQEDYK